MVSSSPLCRKVSGSTPAIRARRVRVRQDCLRTQKITKKLYVYFIQRCSCKVLPNELNSSFGSFPRWCKHSYLNKKLFNGLTATVKVATASTVFSGGAIVSMATMDSVSVSPMSLKASGLASLSVPSRGSMLTMSIRPGRKERVNFIFDALNKCSCLKIAFCQNEEKSFNLVFQHTFSVYLDIMN